jgi:hypothetical protein
MITIEKRFVSCPQCGDERGTSPDCELCKQYNPELKNKPKFGPGSDSWEELKRKTASK